jgi:hypothetical protein
LIYSPIQFSPNSLGSLETQRQVAEQAAAVARQRMAVDQEAERERVAREFYDAVVATSDDDSSTDSSESPMYASAHRRPSRWQQRYPHSWGYPRDSDWLVQSPGEISPLSLGSPVFCFV